MIFHLNLNGGVSILPRKSAKLDCPIARSKSSIFTSTQVYVETLWPWFIAT